jgi:transcription initiation factor TFIIH subunit 3
MNPFEKVRVSVEAARESIQLLVVILDTNPFIWGKRKLDQNQPSTNIPTRTLINFTHFMNHVLLFANAYLCANAKNKIAFIAAHTQHSNFLFPRPHVTEQVDTLTSHVPVNNSTDQLRLIRSDQATEEFFLKEISFNNVRDSITEQMKDTFRDLGNSQDLSVKGSAMSGAISRALCFINRLEREKPIGTTLTSRILTFQVSPDISTQYISIMNAIFSAQKMSVMLDSCVLSTEDSSFLQQASYITGGVYLKPIRQEGLIQYLLSVFIVEKSLRNLIQLPVQSTIDFRAACFETKKQIDLGWVCSVCLSIFSKFNVVCSTCGVKFDVQLQPIRQVKPGTKPTITTTTKDTSQ